MRFSKIILDLIFPETCPLCRRLLKNRKSCIDCEPYLKVVPDPSCPHCSTPLPATAHQSHLCPSCLEEEPAFHWHRSCYLYTDPVASLLYRLKYGAALHVVPWMGERILQCHGDLLARMDVLLPVPMSTGRLRKRTYNQSLEMARFLGRKLDKPVLIHSLQKIRETKPQTELKRKDRLENLRGAFAWKGKKDLEGKKVLLIDDVFTTGSTLQTCARALSKAKPAEIGAVTFALNRISENMSQ